MNLKTHPLNVLLILFSLTLFAMDYLRIGGQNILLQVILFGILSGETTRKRIHILNLSLIAVVTCVFWLYHLCINGVWLNKMLTYWYFLCLLFYVIGLGIHTLVRRYLDAWRYYLHFSVMGMFYLFVLLTANSFFFFYDTTVRVAVLYWAVFAFFSGVYLYKQGWKTWQHALIFLPYILMVLSELLPEGWEAAKILLVLLFTISLGMLLAYGAHRSSGQYALSKFAGCLIIVLSGLLVTYDNMNHESSLERRSPWTHQNQLFLYEGDTITLDYFEGKVLVLDFWNTTCGVCFQKFPQLEKLHKQFENNPDVLVLAVNNPLKRDPVDKARVVMEELGYSFGNLYALDTGTAADFDIHFFPVVLYLKAEEGSTYIRGNLESKWYVLRNSRRLVRNIMNQ